MVIIILIAIGIGFALAGALYNSGAILGVGCGVIMVTTINFFFWGYMAWRDFDKKKGISFYKSLYKTFGKETK